MTTEHEELYFSQSISGHSITEYNFFFVGKTSSTPSFSSLCPINCFHVHAVTADM